MLAVAWLVTDGAASAGAWRGDDRGQIQERPTFLEVYLDQNQLFYRPVSADESASDQQAAGVLLFSN